MGNNIRIFENEEFGKVRVTIDKDGNPLFYAKDVAQALGYSEPIKAIERHCKSGTRTFHPHSNGIGGTHVITINEADVFRLIMRSNMPKAEIFQDWVCGEVLPSIRKTGGYMVALPEETNEELLARALLVAKDAIKRRDEKIHELEVDNEEANKTIRELERDNSEANKTIRGLRPKAELMEKVIDTGKSVDIGQAAKFLKLPFGRNTLFKKLREKGILFKERNEPKQKYIDQKLFELKEKFVERSGYNSFVVPKVMVTQKGMEFLYKLFKEEMESKQIVLEALCQ